MKGSKNGRGEQKKEEKKGNPITGSTDPTKSFSRVTFNLTGSGHRRNNDDLASGVLRNGREKKIANIGKFNLRVIIIRRMFFFSSLCKKRKRRGRIYFLGNIICESLFARIIYVYFYL